MASLAPVQSESSTCTHCSAALVADQRYCLSCGQPSSPVRLAFLDVLQSERSHQLTAPPMGTVPAAYAGYPEPVAGPVWLRRYAPLLGVLSVLLLAMIIGLLVGHWVTQSRAPSQQIVKVEGLPGVPSAAASTAAAAPTAAKPAASAKSTATPASTSKEEREEAAEAKAEEKKPIAPPQPIKVNSGTLSKLTNSTGKKHQEEINKIGTAPIEVP
jgi:hypothetical protein